MTPRRKTSRRWASRGAAYTETVVMLPFFIAVWACMLYVNKAYSTKVNLMAQNRRCVYTYSYGGCNSQPSGCTNNAQRTSGAGERPGDLNSLQGLLGGVGSSLFGALFGQSTSQRSTTSVNKPRLLGGGSTQVLAGNELMCNVMRTTPADVARQAFCGFTGFC